MSEDTHLLYYSNNTCIINCPYNIPFENNNECIIHCSSSDFFEHLCKISNQSVETKEYMINTIINDITSGFMNSLLIKTINDENEELIVKDKNELYQIFILKTNILNIIKIFRKLTLENAKIY